MFKQNDSTNFIEDVQHILLQPNAFRAVLIMVFALIAAYWFSRFFAQGIIKIAQIIADKGDAESDDVRQTRLRQTETYLSIATAFVRVLVVVVVGYLAWRALNPWSRGSGINSIAAIGAGTFFALIAGQTFGIVLRDLTAGSIMITEGWYKIGDFIKIEPFGDISGVVERFTLRSTKLRSLNGDVIWIHNQQIAAVHVVPKGVRTIAVDIFVNNKEAGVDSIKKVISAIPRGKTMMAKPLRITNITEWREGRWRITVKGQTAPGREWLVNDFFVQACKDIDDGKDSGERLLVMPPMPHNSDETAEYQFKRAVRVKQDEDKDK